MCFQIWLFKTELSAHWALKAFFQTELTAHWALKAFFQTEKLKQKNKTKQTMPLTAAVDVN